MLAPFGYHQYSSHHKMILDTIYQTIKRSILFMAQWQTLNGWGMSFTSMVCSLIIIDFLKNGLICWFLHIGIKVLLDFVPNHTSDEHEWFQKSIKKIEPFADYYVWKDPIRDSNGNNTPPNNWVSNTDILHFYILYSINSQLA